MKIVVKERFWSSLRVKSEHFETHEYNLEDLANFENVFVDYVDYDERYKKRKLFKIETGYKMSRRIYFAFTIIKREEDKVYLSIQGEAGGIWNEKNRVYEPQLISLGKEKSWQCGTDTKDSGREFILSLVD